MNRRSPDLRTFRWLCAAVLSCAAWTGDSVAVQGGTVVITNRSPKDLRFELTPAGGQTRTVDLGPGAVLPLRVRDKAAVILSIDSQRTAYTVETDSAYIAHATRNSGYQLTQIGLPHKTLQPLDLIPDVQNVKRAGDGVAHAQPFTADDPAEAGARTAAARPTGSPAPSQRLPDDTGDKAPRPANAGGVRVGKPGTPASGSPATGSPTSGSPASGPPVTGAFAAVPPSPAFRASAGIVTIPVVVYVDDEELSPPAVWKERLAKRIKGASDILQAHCFVRLEIVDYRTWDSSDEEQDFNQSLREFEMEANPHPGRLAIGFTGQYQIQRTDRHLGGTRGPLHTHMLIREAAKHLPDRERLEVLVHELGHFMGSVHTPENDTVMRPILGDDQANNKKFRVRFDALNTLAMCTVSEHLKTTPFCYSIADLPLPRQMLLKDIYTEISHAMPRDPAPRDFNGIMEKRMTRVLQATKTLVRGIGYSAAANLRRPERPEKSAQQQLEEIAAAPEPPRGKKTSSADANKTPAGRSEPHPERVAAGAGLTSLRMPGPNVVVFFPPAKTDEDAYRLDGDRLAEYYVQQTASLAFHVHPQDRVPAMLLALAIGLDREHRVEKLPLLGAQLAGLEEDAERLRRVRDLGHPTLYGREDLLQRFVNAAAVAALYGPQAAESLGAAEELARLQSSGGLSWANYQATVAGIVWAEKLQSSHATLFPAGQSFRQELRLPAPIEADEGLPLAEMERRFGGVQDVRFQTHRRLLRKKAEALYPVATQ